MSKISQSCCVIGVAALCFSACIKQPVHGPDKQFGGGLEGAATGAVAGAVTGFQVSGVTGPGAMVGAGMGFAAGAVQGAVKDRVEANLMKLAAATSEERKRALAHEILADQYKRRIELHPAREIYPADLFFYGDGSKLRPSAQFLVEEIARQNKERYPWSRLAIANYVRANDQNAEYARTLAGERCREIGDFFVRSGLEPRRLETRAVVVPAPILLDPQDDPTRYNQAVEIILLDR